MSLPLPVFIWQGKHKLRFVNESEDIYFYTHSRQASDNSNSLQGVGVGVGVGIEHATPNNQAFGVGVVKSRLVKSRSWSRKITKL